ncbi:hypothetical protein KKC22_13465 [Myxococcota bacterium]|nr:hypothetical protein [Myxococcota bacterium]
MNTQLLREHVARIEQKLQEITNEFYMITTILNGVDGPTCDTHPQPPAPIASRPPVSSVAPAATAAPARNGITARQLELLKKLAGDWTSFEDKCRSRFGKAVSGLSTREASGLITDLIAVKNAAQPAQAPVKAGDPL